MPVYSSRVEDDIPPGLRLDRYLAEYLKILSRSQIKARSLRALLNGRAVKLSRPLKGGEYLELSWEEAESLVLIPQDLPLELIYEDARVIVVNKAQGMVVHPGAGNRDGTLANALLYRGLMRGEAFSWSDPNKASDPTKNGGDPTKASDPTKAGGCPANAGGLRPGIVHRLDKDTSGLMIAAWDEEAHAFLADQFKARKVRKTYAALVQGRPKEIKGSINKNIVRSRGDRKLFTVSDREGRRSLTFYKLVKSYGKYSLLLLRPKTGRTHQIRVHLKYLGCPILGDPLYGRQDSRFPKALLMLHSRSLGLVLPGHEEPVLFKSPLPERFREIIGRLRG